MSGLLSVIAFVFLSRIGEIIVNASGTPFYPGMGFSKTEIVPVTKYGALCHTIFGGLLALPGMLLAWLAPSWRGVRS